MQPLPEEEVTPMSVSAFSVLYSNVCLRWLGGRRGCGSGGRAEGGGAQFIYIYVFILFVGFWYKAICVSYEKCYERKVGLDWIIVTSVSKHLTAFVDPQEGL